MIGQLSGGSLGRLYSASYAMNGKMNGAGKKHSVQEALQSNNSDTDKHIELYPDCLVSTGFPSSGETIHMKYDPSSTDADPVIYAWGKNADGSTYEQKIHINQIDPRNATAIEITALHAHQGTCTFDSEFAVATAASAFGIHEKMDYKQFLDDFMDMRQKAMGAAGSTGSPEKMDYKELIDDYMNTLAKAMQKSGLERFDTDRYLFEHLHGKKTV